ncbi:uncharacterized protein YkwD [Microbacterium marinum]|uniref:Uncharacterized protein YkwD n=1 Tax=Microbacterium marinum TaxID=421115 RepID=A0A7W7BP09_9MICO|nr:CAP domain-containing protein [Microbacterium marinum]MBB4666165.1 uncharacterized protein YkwD [Microbacterium marinum]
MSRPIAGFAAALTAALVLTLAPATAASAAVSTSCTSATQAAVQKRILTDVNAARKSAGKKALKASSSMHKVAVAWSAKQAASGTMKHNPNYASQIPKGWTAAAENVAYGYTPQKVTPAWLKSTGHRKNILGGYTHIGIGVACSKAGQPYYTQVFGKY